MENTVAREKIQGDYIAYPAYRSETKELIVWSYGGLSRPAILNEAPRIIVFFRSIDGERIINSSFCEKSVDLTSLGLLAIGTIWKMGQLRARAVRPRARFRVDFTQGAWKFISPSNPKYAPAFDQNAYPFRWSEDKNSWIDFPLGRGQNLLVPCMELLARLYGRSAEIPRILATYRWETVMSKLFDPPDKPLTESLWPIKTRRVASSGDSVFLGHLYWDLYTQACAKRVYSKAESDFCPRSKSYYFPEIAPWFQGAASLDVEGLWVNNGKTFLALRIWGCTDPSGPVIENSKQAPSITGARDEDKYGLDEGVGHRYSRRPEILDLTTAQPPGVNSPTYGVAEDPFVVIGEKRKVIFTGNSTEGSSKAQPSYLPALNNASGAERKGASTDVAFADISAKSGQSSSEHDSPAMEREGVMRSVWIALRKLSELHPEWLTELSWYTHTSGFVEASIEPTLIPLAPFSDSETVKTKSRNWVFFDTRLRTPRGIMVTRVRVEGQYIYLLEVQRRCYQRKPKAGVHAEEVEEQCRGLVVVLDSEELFRPWLSQFLINIRMLQGVYKKLSGYEGAVAHSFIHYRVESDQLPYMTAVMNAFRKLGQSLRNP